MNVRVVVVILILLFSFSYLSALVKGSETAVSVESSVTFPAADNDNTMLGFGWFNDGFTLEDMLTTCSFNDVFPVSGTINLNGGTLRLQQDLIFRNNTTLQGMGKVIGNGHEMRLSQSINQLPSDTELFEDVHIFCDSNVDLLSTITFRGNCTICGRGNILRVGMFDAEIVVDSNSSLELRDIVVCHMKGDNLRCIDDTGSVILDNLRWIQNATFDWAKGSCLFRGVVDLVGSSTFTYSSICTSTIANDSQLTIDNGMSLSMGRDETTLREPIVFTDETSVMVLNNCDLIITGSGAHFTKGEVVLEHAVTIDVAGTSTDTGLIFGDGNADNDILISVLPCATVKHNAGYLVYNNYAGDRLRSSDTTACFVRGPNSKVYLNNNIAIQNLGIELLSNSVPAIEFASGKTITYDCSSVRWPDAEYDLTCNQSESNVYLFNGNCSFFLTKGSLPINVTVSGSGNQFLGTGGISGTVALSDIDSYLTSNLSGFVSNVITLNEGLLTLGYDLNMIGSGNILGPGTVNLGQNHLKFAKMLTDVNTAILWQGAMNSHLVFCCNTSLASTWTFNGRVTIDGGGNELLLQDGSAFVVDRGSELILKNITLSGLKDNNIRCLDNNGVIRWRNANVILDGDYTFTLGSMDYTFDNCISGTHIFACDSVCTCTIHKDSKLKFKNGVTFSMDCSGGHSMEPLEFENKTAILHLDDSIFSIGSEGMQITKGTIRISRNSTIDVNSTSTVNGLMLGNGQASGDIYIEIDPASILNLSTGHLIYNVTSAAGFVSKAKTSRIIQGDSQVTHFMKDIVFSDATIKTSLASFTTDAGIAVNATDIGLEYDVGNYRLTGSRPSSYTFALNGGGDSFYADSGVVEWPIAISGTSNTIGGSGDITGTITLQDSSTVLTLQLLGLLATDVVMNDGTVILANDLYLGNGVMFTGNGIVNLNNNSLHLGSEALSWGGNTYWSGSGGAIHFNTNISLSGTWTFSGNVMVHGNKQTIDLGETGKIWIDSDSTVMFHGITLDHAGNIQCVDDSSRIILDDVTWCQGEGGFYSFDKGAFRFKHKVFFCCDGTFVYHTSQTSTICGDSELVLDNGFTFSYDPGINSKSLLEFADEASSLILKSATLHSTATGMQLTKGRLNVKGDSYLSTEKIVIYTTMQQYLDEGITFGSGVAADDFTCCIIGGASLTLSGGTLVYNNTASNLLLIENGSSLLHIAGGARLVLDQSLQLTVSGIEFGNYATLLTKTGKTFSGSIFPLGYLYRRSKR